MGNLPFPADTVGREELVCAAWKSVVGKRVAVHARAERLVRGKLVVGVDDAIWQRQLFGMSRMIVQRLQEALGAPLVDDLEFRIAPPRREPQRAATSRPADEADGILDDGLRRIYLQSRKRELA